MVNIRFAGLGCLLMLSACGGDSESRQAADPDIADPITSHMTESTVADGKPLAASTNPATGDLLPVPFSVIWEPWIGDYEGMLERRVIRVLVPYGGYQFFYDQGRPRGAVYDLVQRFESFINEQQQRKNIRIYVVVIPVGRDELLPALLAGHADFAAADLTITKARQKQFSFSRPLLTGINEVVVTGPAAPRLDSVDSLAGQPVFVRRSSSYYEHLQRLAETMRDKSLEPPRLIAADELFEAEDVLELVNAGMIGMTVMDDYKARFWAGVFSDIVVRDDLVINDDGAIAWATRNDSRELGKVLNQFLRKYGKGTLVGNDTFNRYLKDAARVRCAHSAAGTEQLDQLAKVFQRYGERFSFEWLMLAAQAFQESGLRQDRRSPAGAVGIMQIKPSTASDSNVGIDDVSTVDNNVHAGAKYLRFIIDRYFADDAIDHLNQWLLGLAAYNAGPAKVAQLRREASQDGHDPNIWFDNVEIIAARRIGRETVSYVSNIFKYYVGYQLISERRDLRSERFGDALSACSAEPDG
jgi:membrane-bound lytic murein transglycosylase MltF